MTFPLLVPRRLFVNRAYECPMMLPLSVLMINPMRSPRFHHLPVFMFLSLQSVSRHWHLCLITSLRDMSSNLFRYPCDWCPVNLAAACHRSYAQQVEDGRAHRFLPVT